MLRNFFLLIILFSLATPVLAANPDEYINLEFRKQTQKKKHAESPAKPSKYGMIPKAGQVWTEPTTGMQFVWVPDGCFMMGRERAGSKPVHKVCLDGFWMGKYEVTNAQFRKYRSGHFSAAFKGQNLNGAKQPVNVSWNSAAAFAKWLSGKGKGKFRLPTEAEWEYAARSGHNYWYAGGNKPDLVSWHHLNSRGRSHDVGSLSPNGFGLYDMSGNVWEWCADWYDKDAYSKHAKKNPLAANSASRKRVLRGGSWDDGPKSGFVFTRYYGHPNYSHEYFYGFRLVRTE
ncbi:formylglycine-generating enzyme family protein [Maridesulfovibrio sp.]|uniref:formylglycine-generating enzyme family protein n=1 Tax=Maridesulfovibrio sp. TaxID=2795000 RepID=UPI003BAC60CA